MKCMEFFGKIENAKAFINTLSYNGACAEIEEGYMPNDDISVEEYEKTKEEYHGWFVWYYPKSL